MIKFKFLVYVCIFLATIALITTFIQTKNETPLLITTNINEFLATAKVNTDTSIKNVYLYKNGSNNIISVNIVFQAGSRVDPKNLSGLNYLLGLTLQEGGGGSLSYNKFKDFLNDNFLKLNVSTSRDSITIQITALKEYSDALNFLIEDIILKSNITNEAFSFAKEVALQTHNFDDQKGTKLLNNALLEELFANNDGYKATTGYIETLKNVSLSNVKNFKEQNFALENLYISVVGNYDDEKIGGLLTHISSKLIKKSAINLAIGEIAPQIQNKTVLVKKQNLTQSEAFLVMELPNFKDKETFLYYSLFSSYLGEVPDSLLFDELRNKNGLVYTTRSWIVKDKATAYLVIYVGSEESKIDISIEKAKQTLQNALVATINLLDTQEDKLLSGIKLAKNWMLANDINIFTNNASIANFLNNIAFNDYTIQSYTNEQDMLANFNIKNFKDALSSLKNNNIIIFKTVK
jgi:predicted Zn-dependent peptidase